MIVPRRLVAAVDFVGAATVLALPVALLLGRGAGEVLVGIVGGLFLLRCAVRREWRWVRAPVMVPALLWWAWTLFCSLPPITGASWAATVQALVMGRYFILVAALAEWVLAAVAVRRAFLVVLVAVAGWIGLQCWQQYLFGVNLFGNPRWMDGALTGPFRHPVAGPALALILFPALMAVLERIAPQYARPLAARFTVDRAISVLVVLLAVATMILIGQRMPALLTLLGLLCCGLLLRGLRGPVLIAVAAAVALLAALPVISPPTFAKLVVHFAQQMGHFWQSDYGLLYTRAMVMAEAHPVLGLGFDGFRHHCADAAYRHGWAVLGNQALAATSAASCNIHPHNHYLEAATEGGVPGLALFCWMVWRWLRLLAVDAARSRLRAGLFVAVLIAVWPLASTSAFFTLPNAGWLFVLLGFGMAQPSVLLAGARTRLNPLPTAARLA